MPPVVTLSGATFSATGITTSEVFDASLVKVNMLVLAKSASSEYIGFVTAVDSNSISVGGWYKRTDGTKGTPDAGSVVYIGMSQRFYGIVVDAQIEDSDIFDGSVVGMEVGIRNNSTTAEDSTGIIITGRFGDVNTTAQLITSDTENKWKKAFSVYKADNILCFENNITGSVLSTHTQLVSNPNNSFINTDFKDGRKLIRNQFSEDNAWTLKDDGTMSTVRGQISYNSETANNGFIHIVSDGSFNVSTITENQVIMIYATAAVTFDQSVNQITASGPSQINDVAANTLGILFRTSPSNVYYVKIV